VSKLWTQLQDPNGVWCGFFLSEGVGDMEALEALEASFVFHMHLAPSEIRKMPYSLRLRLVDRLNALSQNKERL
jgi:hypothetical protein